jgi:hypothetical protein
MTKGDVVTKTIKTQTLDSFTMKDMSNVFFCDETKKRSATFKQKK